MWRLEILKMTPLNLFPLSTLLKRVPRIPNVQNQLVLTPSLLQGASDWKLLVDFDQDQVTFPPEILSTNERPDIVFWSVKARKVILIEHTCPAKEGFSAAQHRKQTRYLSLISQIQEA